jgi:OFA family oxalate/formate antiporter-like MFS transporter
MNMKLKFPKIFFGWWIVGAIFIIALYSGCTIEYGFSAMFDPVVNEFGWTYTQVSLAASLRGLEEGFIVLIIGILVDRYGLRKLILGGVILTTSGFFMLSSVNSLGVFYGAYAVIGFGRSFVGSNIMIASVVNWFNLKSGIASAIALSGFMECLRR